MNFKNIEQLKRKKLENLNKTKKLLTQVVVFIKNIEMHFIS